MRIPESFQTPTEIQATELVELMLHGSRPAILDLRSWQDYCSGHIAGALSVPFDELTTEAALSSDHGPGFILVSQDGDLAELARQRLEHLGAPVTVLVGGMDRWTTVGGDLEEVALPWPMERQIRFVAGGIVVVGLAAGAYYPPTRWIAAFIGSALMFSGVSGRCGLANLLMRLKWNRPAAPSVSDVFERFPS